MLKFKLTTISIILFSVINAQIFTQADPFYSLSTEKNHFENCDGKQSIFLLRPFLNRDENSLVGNWSIGVRSELYFNDNAPNLENTSDKWIGKGISFYQGFRFDYQNKFFALSFEPYYFSNQNKDYTQDWQDYYKSQGIETNQPWREHRFSKLNDMRPHGDEPYSSSGVRNAQAYLHYNGLGIGYSNANMWWGSGIHSSLNMTNNTSGFPHLMIGTIKEQRYKDFGFNFRYIFADSLKHNVAMPFYTGIVSTFTYYSEPTITLGFSRTYLTGGKRVNESITRGDAMKIPFEKLYLKDKDVDIWDQTLVGYLTATFPQINLEVYVEYGRNDHAWDSTDFIRQPDHTGASIIGLRKYGFFKNPNLIGGIEYTNLIRTKYWNDRPNADWYDRWNFDNWSYNGRHWGAHSGPDSDDFYLYFGYMSDKFTILPSFNYERHGVIDNKIPEYEYEYNPPEYPFLHIWGNNRIWAEVKLEYRIDLRYNFKGYSFNAYYEYEKIQNDQFRDWIKVKVDGKNTYPFIERKSHVFWFGVERRFDKNELSNIYKKLINH